MKSLLGYSLSLFLLFSLTAHAAPLKILVTIPPLAFVAQDVAGPTAQITILLPKGSSPHHYQLKPSDRIKIAQADLIIWLGSEAEPYLGSALKQKNNALALFTVAQKRVYQKPQPDIHLWLDPSAMHLLADALADRLGRQRIMYPSLNSFASHDAKVIEVADAFGYLHRALGITPLLIINSHEDRPPSPKQRIQLQQLVQNNQKACIIITPEITETDARRLLNTNSPIILSLDPLGYDYKIKPNTFQYVNFFQQLAQNYLRCAHY